MESLTEQDMNSIHKILPYSKLKYIFDLYWYNHNSKRLNIRESDYLPTPEGGWDNWTALYNVEFMLDMIELHTDFALAGNIDTLMGQARNAGKKANTRAMVGVEVLLLKSAGYTVLKPTVSQMKRGVVAILKAPPAHSLKKVDENLIKDSIKLTDKREAANFWTSQRKKLYFDILQSIKNFS